MKKLIFSVLLIVIMAITNFSFSQTFNDFTLTDIKGSDVTLTKVLEKSEVVLIGFWATWCNPCKEEMKRLEEIYEKYSDKGFEYLAINIDNQKSVSKVAPYVTAQDFKFKVLMDTDKRIFEAYGGRDEMPYSILVNKKQEVIAVHTGFKTGDELKIEEEIKAALGIK